jgi:hypothetical protein
MFNDYIVVVNIIIPRSISWLESTKKIIDIGENQSCSGFKKKRQIGNFSAKFKGKKIGSDKSLGIWHIRRIVQYKFTVARRWTFSITRQKTPSPLLNRTEQCFAAHVVHTCQQYWTILLSLNIGYITILFISIITWVIIENSPRWLVAV